MSTSDYPVSAGFKSLGAADIAARIVDRDPDRKINTMIAITVVALIGTPMVADEIAIQIDEGPLYVRPRISELVNLGILVKGPTRPASVCGRMASVMVPSHDLMIMITKRELQLDGSDDDALWFAVGAMILDRIEAAKRHRRHEAGSSS